ncbi:MAG: carbamoyl-phosphate synthase large subunit [Thaumarchaeota archaeon]|nr:carbamoyl-phosphate synthase large subunit [Candidatus Calditenuaceae archaeon]MDW8043933.1 carbamoyl-phosphate synthase large subunit [Nitrososphaerota archaeon]
MPKLDWVNSVLVIGSGPIVIGQAAEFDYSGSQACLALREDGVKVILVNSNPATIQTDHEIADVVYIEPLDVETVARVLRRERPDALLPTMGGQTGLNLAVRLKESGVLDEVGTKVIGTPVEAIKRAEDRRLFHELIRSIGEPIPRSIEVSSVEEARDAVRELGGYPVLCRASYALGGTGSGVARNDEDLRRLVSTGLMVSMNGRVAVDEYLEGWKEYELEILRDSADNCVCVCPMENLDPLGIHTGESIVVAPAQTLTDEEFHVLRRVAFKVVRAIGIEGACNIQFGVNPESFEYTVIEVNPRVSRSSALASKATGYPIARTAAKIALGYKLDEIPNKVVGTVTAAMEPTVDYVVVKIPRWPVDVFDDMDPVIGTMMKSTGEAMGIGRTFEEALQKAIRSLDIGRHGLGADGRDAPRTLEQVMGLLSRPTWERVFAIREAFLLGMDVEEVYRLTRIDRWFLNGIRRIVEMERELKSADPRSSDFPEKLRMAKRLGFSDKQIAYVLGTTEDEVRRLRKSLGIRPVYKMVDTCAGEFEAVTPYYYSTYEDADEARADEGSRRVLIIGSGPIRIGQGIEFDYCSVHASLALRQMGIDSIVVNNNPETVSTDFDVSTRLYFEPLTFEDVMNVIERERPEGVIVQLGGQTPLKLAKRLADSGVKILGTGVEGIDVCEDRERFRELLLRLGIPQPEGGAARSVEEAVRIAESLGYPVLVRPSYVLGGRGMGVVWNEEELLKLLGVALEVSEERPVLIDKYLYPAVEVDVDAISDGETVFICGILEHVELAGVHSGDAAMVIPPRGLSERAIHRIKEYTRRLALELRVVGFINVQYAVMGDEVYVLEANPRASRTVPFVGKATGLPLVKIATRVMMGSKLRDLGLPEEVALPYFAVKESVFSFSKLPGVDPILEPRMKSTGEVMGVGSTFEEAYWKAQLAANNPIRRGARVLVAFSRETLQEATFAIRALRSAGTEVCVVSEGGSADLISVGEDSVGVDPSGWAHEVDAALTFRALGVGLVVDVRRLRAGERDRLGYLIRRGAVVTGIPYVTTFQALSAAIGVIDWLGRADWDVRSLNELHAAAAKGQRGQAAT